MDDYHMEVLTKHCRVCAKPLARFKVSYRCADRSEALGKTFGLSVKEDNPDVQPPSFCHRCYNVLVRSQKAKEEDRVYTPTVQLFAWSAHTEHSCSVCDHFKRASSGGGPRKHKIGRPSTTSTHSAITHLYAIAPPSLFNPANLNSLAIHTCTSSVSTDDLMCHLCSAIVDRPIQLATCNRLVCMECLCTSLREKGFCCPCCGSDHLHDFNTMVQPSPVVMKVLGDLQVTCKKCRQQIAAGIDTHVQLHTDSTLNH